MTHKYRSAAATKSVEGLGGLPILGRGQHAGPEQGACFMEYASLLAGVGFSDHPRCTHPLLAHIARTVNDSLDDETRQRIAPLVPSVIGIRSPAAALTAALVAQLTARAMRYDPHSRQLMRFHRRAVARSQAVGVRRRAVALSESYYRTGAATQAVALSLNTIDKFGSEALRDALEEIVATARRVALTGQDHALAIRAGASI